MTFSEYVAGKRVVIIAPSKHTIGTGQREFIESHDVVVRINRGWPVPPAMVPDIGERTTALYHLLSVGIAASEDEFVPCIGKIAFIISTHPELSARSQAFKRLCKGRIHFESIPSALRQLVRSKVRKSPNAGIMAITHLLTTKLQSLHMVGFGFYAHGYYDGYNPKVKNSIGGQPGHDQESAKKYVRYLFSIDRRITCDPVTQHILFGNVDPAAIPRAEPKLLMEQPGKTPMMASTPLRIHSGMVMRGEVFFAENKHVGFYERTRKAVRV